MIAMHQHGGADADGLGIVHRHGQRVFLLRTVHPHRANRPVIGHDDEFGHCSANAASAPVMLSAPSVTLRSRPDACTAMFSAKNRARAMREGASPLSRKAASAWSASMQPPAAWPNILK